MKLFIISTLTLLLSANGFAQSPQQWRDSLSVLKERIAKEPYSADLHLRKAAVNIELTEYNYAIEEYNSILRKEPTNISALYFRAFCQMKMRRYDLAKNDYTDIIKITPRNIDAHLGLAYANIRLNRTTDAMDIYNRLAEQYPDSAIVFASRASFEKSMKSYDACLYDWEKAISLEPSNIEYMVSRADILITLDRKEEARQQLDAARKAGATMGQLHEWYRRLR